MQGAYDRRTCSGTKRMFRWSEALQEVDAVPAVIDGRISSGGREEDGNAVPSRDERTTAHCSGAGVGPWQCVVSPSVDGGSAGCCDNDRVKHAIDGGGRRRRVQHARKQQRQANDSRDPAPERGPATRLCRRDVLFHGVIARWAAEAHHSKAFPAFK